MESEPQVAFDYPWCATLLKITHVTWKVLATTLSVTSPVYYDVTYIMELSIAFENVRSGIFDMTVTSNKKLCDETIVFLSSISLSNLTIKHLCTLVKKSYLSFLDK